jgi:drug/metabolite transporter (DMT)-like permease
MAHPWFRTWGWLHRPVSWQGWTAAVLTAMFCVQVFAAVDRHSHSVSDTLYGVFPFFVPALSLLEWVATHTSQRA